jgi:lysophospholipase L1-like esterase
MKNVCISRQKTVLYGCIVISGVLIFALVLGEFVLRMLGYRGAPHTLMHNVYFVDDPVLDWRRIPNSVFVEGKIEYKYNKDGFRDVDHALDKPYGVKRIVVVGDSVTEGYGVAQESSFSGLLQHLLSDKFEVITVALGGLNAPQEMHLLERQGLVYRPDMVVVNFVLNDAGSFSNFRSSKEFAEQKDSRLDLVGLPIHPKLKYILKSSALIYFLKERLENLVGRLKGVPNVDYYERLWASEDNRLKVLRAFDKLAALRERHGFDVVVVIWPLITDYKGYRLGAIHEWIALQARKRRIESVDLLQVFSKHPFRDLQVSAEDSTHPNELGHRLAAETFLAWFWDRQAFRDAGKRLKTTLQ